MEKFRELFLESLSSLQRILIYLKKEVQEIIENKMSIWIKWRKNRSVKKAVFGINSKGSSIKLLFT